MNKSPDRPEISSQKSVLKDETFEADLAREQRIQTDTGLLKDPELSADRALKETLSQLTKPTLPDELRSSVLNARRSGHTSTGWLAMAAAVVLSVIVVLAMDPLAERQQAAELTEQDWEKLALAIETLNTQGRQIARVTQREVSPHLRLPQFQLPRLHMQLDPIPYPNSFRRWFQPSVPQAK